MLDQLGLVLRRAFILVSLLVAITATGAYYFLNPEVWEPEADGSPSSVVNKTRVPVAPPMELLGHGARMPTPEELEDEAHFKDSQVARVSEWLNSPQAEKRLSGVEQLGAYATPESERILASTLLMDANAEVRRTAAQRLSRFKLPTDDTVAALLTALEDESEAVQMSALNTLQGILAKMQHGSPQATSLLASIEEIAAGRRSSVLARQAMLSLLKDQKTSSFPAFSADH